MWLVLGLGNPGPEYQGTRHNVGFAVVDRLAARHGIELSKRRHQALFGRGRIGRVELLLAQPQTYMNLSGEAARPLLQFHALSIEQLLVVHDEADFPAGTVRVKQGGGGGGHNGLSSLLDQLGSGDFIRIRVGIGRPLEGGRDMARYVLARPTPTEAEALRGGVELAADAIEAIVRDGLSRAMNQVNRGA